MFTNHNNSWFSRLRARFFSKRNIVEPHTLEEAGKRLANAAQNLEPYRPEFKADLLLQIREVRGMQQTSSMKEKISSRLAVLFASRRIRFATAVVVLIAIIATSIPFWPGTGRKLLISPAYAQDNFEVTPTQSDSLGVAANSSFTIKSKTAISENELKKNLAIIPAVPYTINRINDHEFTVVPEQSLQAKMIYKIYINSAYVDENGVTTDRDYSWAFQIKNPFKIIGTLPADKTSGVPINTGIELTFNTDKVTDVEKYFSIQPAVKGRFEYHGRTVVFVPEKLEYATLYTVSVNKDVPLKDSAEKLTANLVFQFETQEKEDKSYGTSENLFGFMGNNTEFPSDQEPFLPIYMYGQTSPTDLEVETTIYAFKSAQEYMDQSSLRNGVPSWAYSSRNAYSVSEAGLSKVSTFTAKPTASGYNQYIVFPNKLPAGYYLIVAKSAQTNVQTFLQVTDIATFVSVSNNKALVWVNNIKNSQPVAGARVQLVGSSVDAVTDARGMAVFDSQALAVAENSPDSIKYQKYLLITDKANEAVVSVYGYDKNTWSTFDPQKYWSYLYSDRPMYQSNDTIQLWGFVKPRANTPAPTKLTAQLVSSAYDYYGDAIVIDSQEITVNQNGSFSTAITLNQSVAGYYSLIIKMGDDILMTRQIQVNQYIKPAYQLTVTANKQAVRAGESVAYKVKASFFDGTPVPSLALRYRSNSAAEGIITDSQGEAVITLGTTPVECTLSSDYCSNSSELFLSVFPEGGEEGQIQAQSSVRVYSTVLQPELRLAEEKNKTIRMTLDTKRIDIDILNKTSDSEAATRLAGNTNFTGRLIEISYIQQETGEYYDFISKKTYKTYNYTQSEKEIERFSGTTNANGSYERVFSVKPEKSYKVVVATTDTNGRHNVMSQYIYTGLNQENPDYLYYSLKVRSAKNNELDPVFNVGEKVTVDFLKNDRPIEKVQGSFLFYRLKQGLIDYTVLNTARYEFNFEEQFIPNINISGVWFDGRMYQRANANNNYDAGWYYSGTAIRFDQNQRKLQVEVLPNKSKYEPGEDVQLAVKVTDQNGKPVQAALNLNLVDEAFYNLTSEAVNPLGILYSWVGSGEMYANSTHRGVKPISNAAEGGGCFVAGTKILMADGTEKNIEDVKPGERILTFASEQSRILVPATVKDTVQHLVKDYLIINGWLSVTPEHRIFVNNSWMQIGQAKIGDKLLLRDGSTITINSIKQASGLVPVYNLHIADKHTYIANGVYVHNDKGGDRTIFADVAAFISVQTDANGGATAKFTLPDNITSWRVTAQAISNSLHSGATIINLSVTKPVFVESVLASSYVNGDKPIVKVRAYGDVLKSGDVVDLTASSTNLGVSANAKAKAFEASYFDLPILAPGVYAIRFGTNHGNNKDAIVKTITVLPSRSVERASDFYVVQNGMHVTVPVQGPITLVFTDQGRGQLANMLYELRWSFGDRVDQRIGRFVGSDILKNTLHIDDPWFEEDGNFSGSNYQAQDGGITLLPYSSSDLELSAQVAHVASGSFDSVFLMNYFYGFLNSKRLTREELVMSLYGLSSLGEPVLTQLQAAAGITDLTAKEKLYVGLGLAKLGDQEKARTLYINLLSTYGENLQPLYRLKVSKNDDENIEVTALAAALGAVFKDTHAQGLWNYIADRPTTDILTALPKLMYVQETLSHLSVSPASVTVVIDGNESKLDLTNGSSRIFAINTQQLSTVQVKDVQGSVGLQVRYYKPVADMTNKFGDSLKVNRRYLVNGNPTTVFKEGDVVEVLLDRTIDKKKVLQGSYEIVDFVPSGLRIMSDLYSYGRSDSCYPVEIEGQTIKFMDDYCQGRSIRYYARVVSPGTYIAEAPVVQSFKSDAVKAYGKSEQITIKQK